MESSSLEYEVAQNCNLTQVGGVLGSKGYGIALRKGWFLYKYENFQVPNGPIGFPDRFCFMQNVASSNSKKPNGGGQRSFLMILTITLTT